MQKIGPKIASSIEPKAIKDIDEVMKRSRDLVRIEHVLRQVLNVKGD